MIKGRRSSSAVAETRRTCGVQQHTQDSAAATGSSVCELFRMVLPWLFIVPKTNNALSSSRASCIKRIIPFSADSMLIPCSSNQNEKTIHGNWPLANQGKSSRNRPECLVYQRHSIERLECNLKRKDEAAAPVALPEA